MIEWNLIRAAGIGAYLMLWASVTWGLVATTSLFGKKMPKATSVALHQAFSTLGLLLLATHLGVLLVDRFMPFAPLDLVIPLRATYRPIGVAFGIVAMFTMVVVLVSSWARKPIGTAWWRRLHTLSVPAFSLALVHGFMTGTDTPRPPMFWFYLASTAILLFLVLARAFTAGLRAVRRVPATERPVTKRPVSERAAAAAGPALAPRPTPHHGGPVHAPAGGHLDPRRTRAHGDPLA
jgi:sulfoxide reductase heme-binding subunit YedZ